MTLTHGRQRGSQVPAVVDQIRPPYPRHLWWLFVEALSTKSINQVRAVPFQDKSKVVSILRVPTHLEKTIVFYPSTIVLGISRLLLRIQRFEKMDFCNRILLEID